MINNNNSANNKGNNGITVGVVFIIEIVWTYGLSVPINNELKVCSVSMATNAVTINVVLQRDN